MTDKNDEVKENETPPTAEIEDELKWDRDRAQQLSDLTTTTAELALKVEELETRVSNLVEANHELNEQLAALKSSISEASKVETPESATETAETELKVETINPASPPSDSSGTEPPPNSEAVSPVAEAAPDAPSPVEPPARKIQVV